MFRLLLLSLACLVATADLFLLMSASWSRIWGTIKTTFIHYTDVREISAWCQRNLVADLGRCRREAWHVLGLEHREGRETADKTSSSLGEWSVSSGIEQHCAQEIASISNGSSSLTSIAMKYCVWLLQTRRFYHFY